MSGTEIKINKKPRYSLPLIQPPPNKLINKSETRQDKEEKRNTRLLQLLSSQQQHYENTIQLATLKNEINFLTDKLIQTEEKVCKWKKEFKDLQSKFIQVVNDHTNTKEELEDTRQMLAESEHIRSRWFLKKTQDHHSQFNCTIPKKSTSYKHHSQSLPNNLLRFLKINPRKSSSKTPADN